ncbi:MAG: Ig-like domain-containing protein [Chitinophagales bacterium]
MKIRLLACCWLISLASSAQVANGSFENWANDTAYLKLPIGNTKDTSYFYDPEMWTTSNALTNGTTLGHQQLCTPSTTEHYDGSKSIRILTDSFAFTVSGFGLNIIVPGFAVNGDFKIDLGAFTSFDITQLSGAGVPVNHRIGKLKGQLKYQPVGGDSCAVIGILKKGRTVVAMAQYFRTATNSAFAPFEAPFIYQSCLMPDTAMIIVSSGNPYLFSNIINNSTSGLHKGTVLYADSINMVDTASVPPLAQNDTSWVHPNSPQTISVLVNDNDCIGNGLTLVSATNGVNGSTAVNGASVVYTPSTNFTGKDSFTYVVSNSGGSSVAKVFVDVKYGVGIQEGHANAIAIYPNPVHGQLHISADESGPNRVEILNQLGQCEMTAIFDGQGTIEVSQLSAGMHLVRVVSGQQQVVALRRILVAE